MVAADEATEAVDADQNVVTSNRVRITNLFELRIRSRVSDYTKFRKLGFFVLVLGFFALIATMTALGFVTPGRSALSGIPNDALGAIVGIDGRFARIMLVNPIEIGQIYRFENEADLNNLAPVLESNEIIKPIGNYLVAIGSPTFVRRVSESEKIPWWVAFRLRLRLRKHSGAILWSRSETEPWQFGVMDEESGVLRFTVKSDDPSSFEGDLRETLKMLATSANPVISGLRLPDGTVSKEVRLDPDSLSWKDIALFQDDREIFSYQRMDSKNVCFSILGLSIPIKICLE